MDDLEQFFKLARAAEAVYSSHMSWVDKYTAIVDDIIPRINDTGVKVDWVFTHDSPKVDIEICIRRLRRKVLELNTESPIAV